jgi:hypothetical protein
MQQKESAATQHMSTNRGQTRPKVTEQLTSVYSTTTSNFTEMHTHALRASSRRKEAAPECWRKTTTYYYKMRH